jgi:hypothetical protein
MFVGRLCLPDAAMAAQAAAAAPPRSGADLYLAACAHCHGRDGRGASAERLRLPVPLPDFTDCRFATREPDEDWAAVVHQGGPARGFDRTMPAFGTALSADEIQRVLAHLRSLCRDDAWPRGELNLPRPLVTEKAFPEDEVVLTASVAAEGRSEVATRVVYERRLGPRGQVELALPVAARETGTPGWRGGLGDVAIGYKRALAHSFRTGSIVSVTGELVLPTGSAAAGFGKGTSIFEPFVTVGQLLPGNGFLQFQGGVELPADTKKAEREAFWRTTIGTTLTAPRFGRQWSPMVELLAARALEEGERTQWDLVPQMQVTLSRRQHVMVNGGVRVPLTDARRRATALVFYILWDWFDGGLTDGW